MIATSPPSEWPTTIGRRSPSVDRGLAVAGPLAVAVAALVHGDDAEPIRERETDEVATVRGLVAAVQEQQVRRARRAPLQRVEAEAVGDHVARDVADARGQGQTEVAGAAHEARELLAGGHVQRLGGRGQHVQVHVVVTID